MAFRPIKSRILTVINEMNKIRSLDLGDICKFEAKLNSYCRTYSTYVKKLFENIK